MLMTFSEIAEEAKVSLSQVRRWSSGRRNGAGAGAVGVDDKE